MVPVYNEVVALPAFLAMIDRAAAGREVVLTDGGSTDGTLDLLAGRTVVTGGHGRGEQIALGIEASHGDAVLICHVDSVMGPEAVDHAQRVLEAGAPWGCMTMAFDLDRAVYRAGAFFSNLRVVLTSIAFGDQGIFVTKEALGRVGGFPTIPLMEDYELSRRLRRLARPVRLRDVTVTSARRFEEGGPHRVAARMRRLRHLYRRGVDPAELVRTYERGGDGRG